MNNNKQNNILPALTLMFFSPLITEILPGSTRFSSIFVFPIEMLVWGGGALLIRYTARRLNLGWISILLMGMALSIAEEFIIQQTSIAPMVIQLKGVTYARAFGVNYVYLLWALIYEPVFVVLVPVALTEMIFSKRKASLWISRKGAWIITFLFFIGCFFAWYTWTRIARPAVYHVDLYNPSVLAVAVALILIALFIFIATRLKSNHVKSLTVPGNWILFPAALIWAVLLYALVVLAFGAVPAFPPVYAIIGGFVLAGIPYYLFTRWINNPGWTNMNIYSVIGGVITGAMLAGSVGFIGAAKADLYFKIITNVVAVGLLIYLAFYLNRKARSV